MKIVQELLVTGGIRSLGAELATKTASHLMDLLTLTRSLERSKVNFRFVWFFIYSFDSSFGDGCFLNDFSIHLFNWNLNIILNVLQLLINSPDVSAKELTLWQLTLHPHRNFILLERSKRKFLLPQIYKILINNLSAVWKSNEVTIRA